MKVINHIQMLYKQWLLDRRLRQYNKLVKVLNITTDHTASMKVGELKVEQWAQLMPISDGLASNLLTESLGFGPLAVMKHEVNPANIKFEDVDWNQTKTSKQYIDEMYDEVALKLISNKNILRSMIQFEIKQDMLGKATHVIFKLIALKTK